LLVELYLLLELIMFEVNICCFWLWNWNWFLHV